MGVGVGKILSPAVCSSFRSQPGPFQAAEAKSVPLSAGRVPLSLPSHRLPATGHCGGMLHGDRPQAALGVLLSPPWLPQLSRWQHPRGGGTLCGSRGELPVAPSRLALAAGAVQGHRGGCGLTLVELLGGGSSGPGGSSPCPLGRAGAWGPLALAAPAAGAVVVPMVAQAAGSHHSFHGSLSGGHSSRGG